MKNIHRQRLYYTFNFWICVLIATNLIGQKKGDVLGYQANINLGTAMYFNNSEDNRFNPFSWRISGSQNVKLWKFNAPLRFLLSSKGTQLDYNFSRIGFTPRYKSYKLYLGHTSMDFSEYTLSRKNIFGAGIEGNPGIFRFAAMYGTIRNFRLQQRFVDDFGVSTIRSFNRKAIGGKIGIGKRNNYLDLIAFKSIDAMEELEDIDTVSVEPQENFILGAKLFLRPFRKITFESSVAASGFTTDRTDSNVLDETVFITKVFNPTTSSRLNFAGHASLNLNLTQSTIGLRYKRVDPLFRTLGSNYFQNDLEEITTNVSWRSKTGKIGINSSLGMFRDNVSGTKVQESKRWIGAIFMSFIPTETFGFNTSFSNYQRSTEGQIVEFNDTLRQVSVARNISFSAYKNILNTESATLKLNGYIGFQMLDDVSNVTQFSNSYNSLSANIGTQWGLRHLKFNITPSLLYASYRLSDRDTKRYGFRLAVSKQLLDQKMRMSANTSLLFNDITDKRNGKVLKYQFQTNYKINPKNSFSLRVLGISRNSVIANDFSEYRILSSYGINF